MTDVQRPDNRRPGNEVTVDHAQRPSRGSGRRGVPAWVVIVACASVVAGVSVAVTRGDPASLTMLTTAATRCLVAAVFVLVLAFSVRVVWASVGATWKKIGLVLLLTVMTVGLIVDVFYRPETFDPNRWGGPIGTNH